MNALNVVSLFVAAAILGLLFHEISMWRKDREKPQEREPARWRLVRRGMGSVLLLGILGMLNKPGLLQKPPRYVLIYMGGCLLLCCALLILILWDNRIVLKRLRQQSAQDLLQWVEGAEVEKLVRRVEAHEKDTEN